MIQGLSNLVAPRERVSPARLSQHYVSDETTLSAQGGAQQTESLAAPATINSATTIEAATTSSSQIILPEDLEEYTSQGKTRSMHALVGYLLSTSA